MNEEQLSSIESAILEALEPGPADIPTISARLLASGIPLRMRLSIAWSGLYTDLRRLISKGRVKRSSSGANDENWYELCETGEVNISIDRDLFSGLSSGLLTTALGAMMAGSLASKGAELGRNVALGSIAWAKQRREALRSEQIDARERGDSERADAIEREVLELDVAASFPLTLRMCSTCRKKPASFGYEAGGHHLYVCDADYPPIAKVRDRDGLTRPAPLPNIARRCGACGLRIIPYGVDWPHWRLGTPRCEPCVTRESSQ